MWRSDYGIGSVLLVFAGFALSLASFCSFGGLPGVVFSCLTGALFVAGVARSKRTQRDLFLSGIIFHFAAFYWLPDTLSLFGGFPTPISWLLLVLFAAVSSLQFAITGWIAQRLSFGPMMQWALAFPLAWGVTEFLVPRLFPWSVIHPLISWRSFSGLAELGGEPPLSVLFLWLVSLLLAARVTLAKRLAAFAISLGAIFTFGIWRESAVTSELTGAKPLRVSLVQGNLSTEQKGNIRLLEANLSRYRELSLGAIQKGAQLVIWPESVMNVWTPEAAGAVRGTNFDPFHDNSVPLLYGTLSFRKRTVEEVRALEAVLGSLPPEQRFFRFNTAVGIDQQGKILGMYHKKVLMPFGEYLPLASRFPAIKKISPHSGDFSTGDLEEVINFPYPAGGKYAVWSLICYEDLVPSLGRQGVQKGAELFINLTNDAWYGNTEAPFQHHLLASWRAIETRRFLIRSTNTGLTAIVDPFGTTIGTLPPFEEAVLNEEVRLLQSMTAYARIGDTISWVIVAVAICGVLVRRFGKRPA